MPPLLFVERRNIAAAIAICASVASGTLEAQNIHNRPAPQAQAVRATEAIRIDGKLDEPIWRTAPIAGGFRQNAPLHPGDSAGMLATQRTEVRIAFDDAAIYVAARMYDDSGARGVRTQLVRRDADFSSDYFQIIFDTYHDHIGRLFFMVNPSGVKQDANGLGGGGDPSWDPVWDVKTAIDSLGWTAEMRIPFSEMRYPNTTEEQTWGMQMWRQENRINELSQWSWWGQTESGGPPQFGHLSGLVIHRAPGRGEVLPYAVARSSNLYQRDPTDPFEDQHEIDARFGADARVLLTSNLTLNATVNPDFGQVEVDPAVVNLSAFETFFDEKRPFFVEGAGYFSFGGLNCYFCSNVSSLSTFYSRRIGRAPSMTGNTQSVGDYADVPDNTSILGAAKLTGRTRSGWSIGVLDAVTADARATVLDRNDSTLRRVTVEPPANYFVGRFAKDLRGGATQMRGIATSVVRFLGDDQFLRDRLNAHSELVGLGTDSYFNSRKYRLMAQVAMSSVSGDTGAIRRLQNSSARYFNRPDRGQGSNGIFSDRYDPTATTMRGLGAYARFSRETGSLQWELAGNMRTPGFENNDIAALSRVDYMWMNANVLRQWTRPTSWYRNLMFIVGAQQQYNFDGDLTDRQAHGYMYWQPLNYWNFNAFFIHRFNVFDERRLRGGPVVQLPSNDFVNFNVSSDSRKRVVLGLFGDRGCNQDRFCSWDLGGSIDVKPASNITLSMGPSYSHAETGTQFVTSRGDSTVAAVFDSTRYIFGDLVQSSWSMNTRLNITFTTNLTFELFVQPLIASGRYDRFSDYPTSRTRLRRVFGVDAGTVTRTPTGANSPDDITIDPDGAGNAAAFTFSDPGFTFRSLRGNAVLRWEYRPGSTLFFVWTRSGSSSLFRGDIDFRHDASALFEGPSDNIFLVKLNYRIGL